MLTTLWGNWGDGRLDQKSYATWMIVTIVAFLALAIGVGLAAGLAQAFLGSWLDHIEAGQRSGLTLTFIMLVFAAMLVIGLAQLNLVIKRGRDTGLPGLWVGIAYLAFLGFGGALVMAIILAFVPSGQFAKAG